jgi:hypothetical protein
MAAIVSTCCCEDDDGGGGDDPSDFKICCEDPPEKLTISVNAMYEMQASQSVISRRLCCPGDDCSDPSYCLGTWWNSQTSRTFHQLISGTIEIDLSNFESTMTTGSSSFVERGECHWSCSLPCAYANCPCSNSMDFQNDGSETPQFFVQINRAITTSNYRCTGETIYAGDCVVTLTLVSGFAGDFNYNLTAGCNDGSQSDVEPPEDQVYGYPNYAKVGYRIHQREGSCEISSVPYVTEMDWGPLLNSNSFWYTGHLFPGTGDPLETAWDDRYGTMRPGDQHAIDGGSPCVRNGFPNGSWDVSYDETDGGGGNCTHPDIHQYDVTGRSGNWSCTTTFDSSAVFS